MDLRRTRQGTSDLAALDGKTFSLDKAMTLVSFVLLFVIVFIPIFMIVYNAFFFEGHLDIEMFKTVVFSQENISAMTHTVIIGLSVTVVGTIIGLFYAWLLGRSDIPCKNLMRALFMIPYMFPPFFGAMAWDMLLSGRGGYVNTWLMNTFHLAAPPFNINSLGGIIFVEVSYYFPFVFMQVVSALERMDPTLEESARIAGASQGTVIRKITIPLVTPAISAGALLILISSLAHFGVPAILGFSKQLYTLPTVIYAYIDRAGGSFEGIRQGAALSILLVFVVTMALILQKVILSSGSYDIIKGKSMRPTLIKLRGAKYPLLILAVLTLVLIVLVPLIMIFLEGLVKAYGLPLIPANFTLDNFRSIITSKQTMDAIQNSMFLSISAGILCMFLGVMVAYVVIKIKPKGKEILEMLSVLPYSIPGTVLAIGVILSWSGQLGISLYNTIWIILEGLVKAYGLPLIPANFTLDNFRSIITSKQTMDAIQNSMFLSISAGILCMFLGVMVAYVVIKIKPKGKEILEMLSVLPYSIPGTVLAIGVILSWSGQLGISLYNTIWIILVAYMARYLSFSMKSASASLQQVHPSLEEAARACGASHTESLKDITLPLIRPAMVAGFFLIFLPSMRELTTSILLYGPYTRTLGVQIFALRDSGQIPQASALAAVAICIIIICNAIVTQITKDKKGV